jgi:hypothetical protein
MIDALQHFGRRLMHAIADLTPFIALYDAQARLGSVDE